EKVQSPAEFLDQYVSGDRKGTSPRGRSDTSAPPEDPAVIAARAANDKETMKRSIIMNVLKTGQARGIPMGLTEGWDALQNHLEDYEKIYLAGANDAQKEGFEELKAEVTREAPRNRRPPGEYFANKLEPNRTAAQNFRTDSIAHLSSVVGFDITSKDRSAYLVEGIGPDDFF